MHGVVGHALLLGIIAASIILMLVRPRGIAEVYWVGAGAILIVLLRLIPLHTAGHAIAEGTDVYLFLAGMMLLSELARENGVFDWLSTAAVHAARKSCGRLFVLIYAVGTAVTICMSNDATAVVLTPAVLAAVRKARVQPLPFLFACAMIANAASFVLPISNPANLVVFRADMPSLGRWMAAFLLPSLLSIGATLAILRWYFRKDLCGAIEVQPRHMPLPRSGKVVVAGLGLVVVVLLIASALTRDLGLPTCVSAVVVAAAVCVKRKKNPWPMMKEISWSTLALVAGLFVMVNAIESVGLLRVTGEMLQHANDSTHPRLGLLAVSSVIAVANNVLNNLPVGLISGATLMNIHAHGLMSHAVLIGVDLGPNLSVTGSLATILWLSALRREDVHVKATDFLKVGLFAMPAALLASIGGLLVIHAILPAR